jgi:thioredoxin
MEQLNYESFQEKIMNVDTNMYQGKLPVILDFYADWCVPCKNLAPTLEELSKEYEGKVNIYKVNTEEQDELSALFNIRSLPSVIMIPMDGKHKTHIGVLPKYKYKEMIDDILK